MTRTSGDTPARAAATRALWEILQAQRRRYRLARRHGRQAAAGAFAEAAHITALGHGTDSTMTGGSV